MSRISALSLTGALVASYACEDYTSPAQAPTTQVKTAAHHIVVVDRSGSMYGEMATLKGTLEKVLTLQEYDNENLLVTLISYSSQGDVTTHFSRAPITEIMKAGSAQVEAIRRLQATALTCISGGLAAARSQIRAGEVTLITLHSDGYANHPSASAEVKNLQRETEALASIPGVVVNAVAHREYSDFNLLNSVASQVGGTAVLARSAGEVFNTLRDSTKALASGTATATVIPGVMGRGKGTVLVIDTVNSKILGGPVEKDLTVRGIDPGARVVRLFDTSSNTVQTAGLQAPDHQASVALAYYLLGRKQVGRARDLVRGTQSAELVREHGRAMTSSQVQAMTLACQDAALNPEKYFFQGYETVDFVALGQRAPVSTIFAALNRVARDTLVSTKSLTEGYKRRSMRSLAGSRDKVTGVITLPVTKLVRKQDADFVPFTGVEPNSTTAIMNITVSIPSSLANYEDGSVINDVAGIDVSDLRDFRSYTVVAEGDVKIPKMVLKFKTKQAHAAMAPFLTETVPFSPMTEFTLDLTNRSLLPANAADLLDQEALKTATEELGPINVLISFLKAALKSPDATTTYTPDQVAALKAVHLSEKLYHSAPSCTAHPDLDAAIAKGEVDMYNKYSVEAGTRNLLTLDRIPSANAFLQRWFTVTDATGITVLEKPTIPDAIAQGAKLTVKTPGPRMKVTTVDDLILPIYKALLLDGDTQVLEAIQAVSSNWFDLIRVTRRTASGLDVGLILGEILKNLQDYKETLQYNTTIPFAMYVGSTGSLPESWKNVNGPLDAEEFSKVYPDVNLTKAETADSLFYVLQNGLIVTVTVVSEKFTVSVAA